MTVWSPKLLDTFFFYNVMQSNRLQNSLSKGSRTTLGTGTHNTLQLKLKKVYSVWNFIFFHWFVVQLTNNKSHSQKNNENGNSQKKKRPRRKFQEVLFQQKEKKKIHETPCPLTMYTCSKPCSNSQQISSHTK